MKPIFMGHYLFNRTYKKDVADKLSTNDVIKEDILSAEDIEHLPIIVQNYLKYVGAIGKPKIHNVYIVSEGQMRAKGKAYFPFTSEQYNFFKEPTRLFFMNAKIKGLVIPGYHKYSNRKAKMDIRLFGLIKIVNPKPGVLDKAETVTFFNDMCLLAPAALIDSRIQWEEVDAFTIKAIFTNDPITVSAILYFNDEGQLINFESEDRLDVNEMKQYKFSTPVSTYKNFDGYQLISCGDMIWHHPDGAFKYGQIRIKHVVYNVK